MRRFMCWAFVLVLATFAVACARSATLADKIADCNFRFVNSDITEGNFSTSGSPADVSDVFVVSHETLGGMYMTNAETESAIEQKGLRSATLVELLDYVQAKWNGKDTIVAMGSLWESSQGSHLAPIVYGDKVGRKLDLIWEDSGIAWGGGSEGLLFLVVRK